MIAFLFSWGLSLYSFYRISKKEETLASESVWLSMRYLITDHKRAYRNSMGKSLVIVEVSGQGQDYQQVLGSNFVVKSSVGHIRDLPTAGATSAEKTAKTSSLSKEEKAKGS